MQRWLIFDTETTGLLKPSSAPLVDQPQIIELGLVSLCRQGDEPWVVTEEGVWLINPGSDLLAETTRITGITDNDLRGQPGFAEVLQKVQPWFLGTFGLIAHNLPFDLGVLVAELRRIGQEYAFPYPPNQLCTVEHYRPAWGRRMKLTELYERVMGKPFDQKHRALGDCRALAEVVIKEGLLG